MRYWESCRPGAESKVILMGRAFPLPSMMQNYLLTLDGARLRAYLLVSIPVQALVGLGLILLGDAVLSGDLRWAPPGLFLVAVVWVALRVIRKRSNPMPPLRSSPPATEGD